MKAMKPGVFRLRKTSDVRQEHAIYELVDEDRNILMDVTKNDAGRFEACIIDNQGDGRVVELNALLELIDEARRLIDEDA
jgi:hypothetical protein